MRALITGITGQDGPYLAQHLAASGWEVHGMVRGQPSAKWDEAKRLVPGLSLVSGVWGLGVGGDREGDQDGGEGEAHGVLRG